MYGVDSSFSPRFKANVRSNVSADDLKMLEKEYESVASALGAHDVDGILTMYKHVQSENEQLQNEYADCQNRLAEAETRLERCDTLWPSLWCPGLFSTPLFFS